MTERPVALTAPSWLAVRVDPLLWSCARADASSTTAHWLVRGIWATLISLLGALSPGKRTEYGCRRRFGGGLTSRHMPRVIRDRVHPGQPSSPSSTPRKGFRARNGGSRRVRATAGAAMKRLRGQFPFSPLAEGSSRCRGAQASSGRRSDDRPVAVRSGDGACGQDGDIAPRRTPAPASAR